MPCWRGTFAPSTPGAQAYPARTQSATERLAFQPAETPLAQGSYRALAATANNFARESHIDELAAACGIDPLQLRLRHLSDERLAAVLSAAADEAGWAGDHGGAALGIACGVEKDARVATCVQLRMDGGMPRIERIVTVVECGAVVDPDNLVNQIEGATVMGLGGALFEAVHFADGHITNASMTAYRVPRFADVPPIDVIVLDRPDLPAAGAGEIADHRGRSRHRERHLRRLGGTPALPPSSRGRIRRRPLTRDPALSFGDGIGIRCGTARGGI